MLNQTDVGSNPLLASTNNINHTASIVFTIIYVAFFLCFIIKAFRQRSHRFIIVLFCLLSLVRIAAFATRASISHHNQDGKSTSRDEYIASAVLLVAGYMFLLEALCRLTIHWIMELRGRPLAGFRGFIFGLVEHMVLLTIMSIGIVGAVNEFKSGITSSELQHAKHERVASGVLFTIVVVLLWLLIVYGAIKSSRQSSMCPINKYPVAAYPGAPPQFLPPRPANHRTTVWLFMICICSFVEVIYRIWSSAKFSGWIIKEVAVDVLVFAPEAIAMLAVLCVDFTNLLDLTLVGQKRRTAKDIPMYQIGS